MSWKSLVCAGLVCLLASPVMAAPTITVTDGGLSGGNQLWNVSIAPDTATFTANTSLAAEIDFEFAGDFVSATLNDAFWNVGTVDNSGNNPFSGTVTDGIWLDGILDGELFIAAGSELFATSAAMPFATITTVGAGGTLSWGGNAVDPVGGGANYTSTRIAQEGANFDGIAGSFPIGALDGDYDDSAQVAQGDLDLVLLNWGDAVPPTPTGWINQIPTDGQVSQNELDGVLLNWGDTAGAGSLVAGGAVPEPTSLAIGAIAVMLGALVAGRRRGV